MNIQEHIEEVKKALEYFSDYDPEAADNVVVDDGLVHLAAIEKMIGSTPTDEDLMVLAGETAEKCVDFVAPDFGQEAHEESVDQIQLIILQALKKAVQK